MNRNNEFFVLNHFVDKLILNEYEGETYVMQEL
jgi:hypothetical protein